MVPNRPTLAFLVAAAVAPLAARADYGPTRWGMTPEQVVAAVGPPAHLIPPAARVRADDNSWEMAVEGIREPGLYLTGGYTFARPGGGLTCVLYNAIGDDIAALERRLLDRYGKPQQDFEFGPLHGITWRTPDHVEFSVNKDAKSAVVSHCAPGKD